MRPRPFQLLVPAVLIALASLGWSFRQAPAADAGAKTAVQPGSEAAVLERYVGDWDAALTMHMGPMGTLQSKGVEKNRLICGGKWLESTFTGEMMGAPFEGRGLFGFDARKQKYVGVWIDSMSPFMPMMEGTYAAETATLTFTYDAQDFTGQDVRAKEATTFSEGGRSMRMFMTPPGGAETLAMEIAYTRRAAAKD